MTNFCDMTVLKYELTASEMTDTGLMNHLFKHYPTLEPQQWADPMFRKWRRCVIVELLKRGLITEDPGHGEP